MMIQKLCICTAFIAFAVFCCPALSFGQMPANTAKIPWSLTVVIMDGTDRIQQAEIPVTEAVEFIEANSRFVFDVKYITSTARHGYTSFRGAPDKNKRGKKGDFVHYMLGWDVPKPLVR